MINRVYVAGRFEEKELVRQVQESLRKLNYIIQLDWTWHERSDHGFPSQYAIEDILGASTADIYVGIFLRSHSYKGALVEMGAALGNGKKVIIVGHAIDTCIFVGHPLAAQFETIDSMLDYMREIRY